MSVGSILLAGGAAGKRYALPNSRMSIHPPLGGVRGHSTDIEIHAREILRLRSVERDRFLTAEQATERDHLLDMP